MVNPLRTSPARSAKLLSSRPFVSAQFTVRDPAFQESSAMEVQNGASVDW